ncbi:EcoKI restriction-modification system protein HsdS [Pseudomonas oleovorans subsp. oleovorans]|uniref:Type I restriction-modification system subunit S n=3 Tax=Ectopseudomonas oleovorans TaxID=301 RepID=A0A379JV50_ECTOL|nr:EcoKI restriction-modification system protein HsdS [Pseudomonas oleovorans subsp. oleovorans]SUD52350.1 type I restriction-modification system subunit S [Pseudomonas oleovorans]
MFIALPHAEEVDEIASRLDRETARIDALIEKKTRFIELLREKRQALITHAVTKGLDPNAKMKDSGVEWLGEVPEHWDVGVVSRVATRTVVGIAEAATHAYADSGTPILRSTNIRPYKIIGEILHVNADFADDRDTKLIHAGDLITVRTGNAGVTAVVPPELEGCQCFTMLITTLKDGMQPDYYCYWMNSAAAVHYFSIEGWGTAQVNISVPILKSLPVPIPPTDEQKRVVGFLHRETQRLDMLLAKTERSIDLLKERRSALITAAVTGQINLREAV